MAGRIANGATRNLLLHNLSDNITEDRVRADLEHIHNLVVVDAHFEGNIAHISLDSVHNALYARTCLMSRGLYKNVTINWYTDECAGPMPAQMAENRMEPQVLQPKHKLAQNTNRFGYLNMDGTEDGSEVDEERGDEEGETTDYLSSFGDETSCTETSVTA